jgi:hypothetical protein
MLKKSFKTFDSVTAHLWNTQMNLGIIMAYLVNKWSTFEYKYIMDIIKLKLMKSKPKS